MCANGAAGGADLGLGRQQRSRFLRAATSAPRLRIVRRFSELCGQYPWQWSPGELEALVSQLTSGERPVAASTVRSYQVPPRLSCELVTGSRFGWAAGCDRRYTMTPLQICHEWSTVAHVGDSRRNARAEGYGTFGSVQVRYGNASRGSPPRRAHRADGARDGLGGATAERVVRRVAADVRSGNTIGRAERGAHRCQTTRPLAIVDYVANVDDSQNCLLTCAFCQSSTDNLCHPVGNERCCAGCSIRHSSRSPV